MNAQIGTRAFCGWEPRFKLALLVAVILSNVIIAEAWLSLCFFLTALSLAVWSRVPWKEFWFFLLAPFWATLMVFLGFSAGFGITPIFSVGPFTFYREGMLEGLSAAFRVAADVSWCAVFMLTTPFDRILWALRWFRVPEVLVDTIASVYRYALLMLDEFRRMRNSARMRGGLSGYLRSLKALSLMVTQVFLRAYDRAYQINLAMAARGGQKSGEASKPPSDASDTCPNRCDVTPVVNNPSLPVLECENVSFTYPRSKTPAVNDVTLKLQCGETVVVCGPNGSGKTTLLKLLSGHLLPTSGKVKLSGEPLNRKNRNNVFRRIGILFDDPNAQLFCTHVRDDVAYGPKNMGLEPEEVDRLVETALDLMEVRHLADRPIHTLSHGEMKRVGLAGLIAMRPPLILLDEPTSGLDPAAARQFVALVRHLNRHHGYTFLIVTHSVNMAPELANRVIILDKGSIIADGPMRRVLSDVLLLEKSRLEPPILARLFWEIGLTQMPEYQIPVTVDEAAALLKAWFEECADGEPLLSPDLKEKASG